MSSLLFNVAGSFRGNEHRGESTSELGVLAALPPPPPPRRKRRNKRDKESVLMSLGDGDLSSYCTKPFGSSMMRPKARKTLATRPINSLSDFMTGGKDERRVRPLKNSDKFTYRKMPMPGKTRYPRGKRANIQMKKYSWNNIWKNSEHFFLNLWTTVNQNRHERWFHQDYTHDMKIKPNSQIR